MITVLLGTGLTVAVLAWVGFLMAIIKAQRKTMRVTGQFVRTIHRLAIQHAETEPFARIVLDEHAKYSDRIHDLGEPKKAASR